MELFKAINNHNVTFHKETLQPSKTVHVTSNKYNPVDTERKLNIHKTFRRRSGRILNVLCTFNLRPVFTGKLSLQKQLPGGVLWKIWFYNFIKLIGKHLYYSLFIISCKPTGLHLYQKESPGQVFFLWIFWNFHEQQFCWTSAIGCFWA